MGLKEEKERLEKELAAQAAEVPAVEDEIVEESEEPGADDDVPEGDGEEDGAGDNEPKGQPAAPAAAQPDNQAIARYRWEAAEARRRSEDLEKKVKALEEEKAAKPAQPHDPEPDKTVDFEGWVEWANRQIDAKTAAISAQTKALEDKMASREQQEVQEARRSSAINEFVRLEQDFKATRPDYDHASAFYLAQVERSVLLANPGMSPDRVADEMVDTLLKIAGRHVLQGKNPVEAMYQDAVSWGYKAPEAESPAKTKVNLKVVDANRRRTASVAATPGSDGRALVDLADIQKISPAAFSNLSDADRARLRAQAMGR